ncbi:YjhT family mutarotase [Vibrio mimicus]
MTLNISTLPELPTGVKHGVGGRIGQKLYAGLGSAGNSFYVLDLTQQHLGWQNAADFPGVARNDAAYTVCGDRIYVFSGAGVEKGNNHPTVLMDGYAFDSKTNCWTQLESHPPVGFLGASCCSVTSGSLVFFGGYRKETFDNFLRELSNVDSKSEPLKAQQLLTQFMNQQVDDYGWNQQIWGFSPTDERWFVMGENPFKPNCGAGIIHRDSVITLIEGEIKPGLRSLETKSYQLQGNTIVQSGLCPAIVDVNSQHEGLAGHYVAEIKNCIYAIGGAYFIGSQGNFKAGKLYSHHGLQKHYSDDVWSLDGSAWQQQGKLDFGIAYGIAASNHQSIYLVGGENAQGDAIKECFKLNFSEEPA